MGGGALVLAPGAGRGVRIPVVGIPELRRRRAGGQDRADRALRGGAGAALRRQRHVGQARRPGGIAHHVVDAGAALVAHAQVLGARRQARIDLPLEGAVHALALALAGVVDGADVRQLAQHVARRGRGIRAGVAEPGRAAVRAHREHIVGTVDVLHREGPVVAVDGDVEQRAHLAEVGVPAVADKEAAARAVLVRGIAAAVDLVHAVLDVARGGEALVVEWRAQADIDGAGDAALELVGGGRFIDFHARDRLDRQVLVRQAAAGRGEDLVAVERGGDVRQAADDDGAGFAAIASHLHAGHALQRIASLAVGELADVVGVDGVHHLRSVALDVFGRAQALAQAGDLDHGGGRDGLDRRGCRGCRSCGSGRCGLFGSGARGLGIGHGLRQRRGAIGRHQHDGGADRLDFHSLSNSVLRGLHAGAGNYRVAPLDTRLNAM